MPKLNRYDIMIAVIVFITCFTLGFLAGPMF